MAMALLILLALALAALTLGAFASLNSGAPLLLRSTGTVTTTMFGQLGLPDMEPLDRALILTMVTGVVAALAAYIKPRS